MWRSHVSAAVVAVLAYLVVVLTMGVNNEEQCDKGGTAGDDDDNNRQGDGSKSFGVGGGGGFNEDRRQRRAAEGCQWARYTSLSQLGNCLHSDPELCRAMLLMLGTWWHSSPWRQGGGRGLWSIIRGGGRWEEGGGQEG